MSAPIIFSHFGNSEYLPTVLKAAKHHNPDKEIIFLGDQTNAWLGSEFKITHVPFLAFANSAKVRKFRDVFRLVQGPEHNHLRHGTNWVQFVFERWFYIGDLVEQNGIKRFWHFDSDNMILDQLSRFEDRFREFDLTEQCNGICINGFINNANIVHRYTDKIIEFFLRTEYLNDVQSKIAPGSAVTEMWAYTIFKEEEQFSSARLNTVTKNESFDDCLCQDHGMEVQKWISGHKTKALFQGTNGSIYCREIQSGDYVRMVTLNLSWLPQFFFDMILSHAMIWKNADKASLTHPPVPLIRPWKVALYLIRWAIPRIMRRIIRLVKPNRGS